MKRHRRLRQLEPDAELIRRRAAGETLREIAPDYAVVHTTLSRYFARPEVAKQLKQAGQVLRAEQRAAEARWRAEQKTEREGQRRAEQQKVAEGRSAVGRPPAAASRPQTPASKGLRTKTEPRGSIGFLDRDTGQPIGYSRSRVGRGGDYGAWLDERDARVPLPPDRRVRLVTESGQTIGRTSESNAERMRAALEPRHGPLTVVPA